MPESKNKIYRNEMAGPDCRCCGTCCKNGGPSFHLEDKSLIEKGIILSKDLYTIRKGELARDNVTGCLISVKSDIIKIKGRGKVWTCTFYDEAQQVCIVYDNRPVECRALKCWDTREIEQIYNKDRLTRKDVLEGIEGVWDIIQAHQKRCDYQALGLLTARLKNSDDRREALGGINEMLRYDKEIRGLVSEKGGLDPEMTDFLFGRSLMETLVMFKLKVEEVDGRFKLRPI
jgi:Fe-S-cluster containining protein